MKKSWILLILIILVINAYAASDLVLQGLEAYKKGEYSKAISYFKRATELAPQDGDNFVWLGIAYRSNGQYQEAIDVCKQSLSLPHTQTWGNVIWAVLASSQDNLGQMDLAISSQKKAVELTPDNSDAFAALASYYRKNKQYDEAITAGKRAIELQSDNDTAYINLGVAYGGKKQYDEAIKAIKKAIEINPKMSTAYAWMGRFLMEKNAYNEAAEAYKKGIEAAPSIDLYPSLARAYYTMGRYDDAIATIDKAIELQTYSGVGLTIDNVKTDYPVVTEVENSGPAKKADIQVGDKILKIDGKSTKGWTGEKVSQNMRGVAGTQVTLTLERKSIDKPFERLITREKIMPEGAASSIGIRSLIYRHKGDLDKAFSDAEKAYSLTSSNNWAQIPLGAAYLDRGKNDEAIKLLSQVKDSATARLLEATAYAKQGKANEAATIYLSIPEEDISPKNIPLMNDRMALLQTFKPFVKAHMDKAGWFESKGQHKAALSELSEALKTADETEAQAIQESIFSMTRKNPSLSEMPEDARKYVLRGEMLVKEGNFEQAATEFKKAIGIAPYAARLYYNSALINAELKKYPEAIRQMKIYLQAAPDASDARAAKDEIIKWEFMMEKEK